MNMVDSDLFDVPFRRLVFCRGEAAATEIFFFFFAAAGFVPVVSGFSKKHPRFDLWRLSGRTPFEKEKAGAVRVREQFSVLPTINATNPSSPDLPAAERAAATDRRVSDTR